MHTLPITARRALQLFALTVVLWAFTNGAYEFIADHGMPASLSLAYCTLAGLSLLVWYRHDAMEHGRAPSMAMSVAMVLLWVLAAPLHLWRSRDGGQKWRMLLVCIGVGALFWFAFLLAVMPAYLRHGA